MFQIVSSQAARFGTARLAVTSVSVVAHAGLITLAAVASGRDTTLLDTSTHSAPTEHLVYVRTRAVADRVAQPIIDAPVRAVKKIAQFVVPDLARLRVAVDATMTDAPKVPDVTTELDLTGRITSATDFENADTHTLVDQSAMYALTHPGPNGAYTEDVVEKTAWPMRENPRPRYPNELQRAGIEGSFIVQFVVDSTGRIDEKTLSFPRDAQPGFLRAVKDALLRSRYLPAELAGMRVRQLVQQQFTFVLAR